MELVVDMVSGFVYIEKAQINTVIDVMSSIFNLKKTILVCSDMNICYKEYKSNGLIQFFLRHGFKQKVSRATHIEGGLIDHVYFRNGVQKLDINVTLYSPYYTANDHDAICVELSQSVEPM